MKTLNKIKFKKRFDISFKGEPTHNLKQIEQNGTIGLVPENFKFIKAKLLVNIGDSVQQGQALFFDKKNPEVYFHSPISGSIKNIVYGHQRKLELIEIDPNDLAPLTFQSLNVDELTSTQAKSAMLERGLWPYLIEMPFQNIPSPDVTPEAIMVRFSHPEPFHAKLSAVINNVEEDLIVGIKWLKKISPKVVVIADAEEQMNLDAIIEHAQVVRIKGDFSMFEHGSALYHIKDSVKENKSWCCDWQYLIKISQTFTTNTYYNQQFISVGGNQEADNQHYQVTEGARVGSIVTKKNPTDRIIFGGLFSGLHMAAEHYLPLGIDAINIIDSNPNTEFMSFIQPGFDKPSFTTAYLSGFLNKFRKTPTSTALNGSERDCVSCGYCEAVCPVDAFPQNILRNVKGDDVEAAMRYGLLDCTSCGVCTYVCPSKIDLSSLFTEAKDQLYKEVTA